MLIIISVQIVVIYGCNILTIFVSKSFHNCIMHVFPNTIHQHAWIPEALYVSPEPLTHYLGLESFTKDFRRILIENCYIHALLAID